MQYQCNEHLDLLPCQKVAWTIRSAAAKRTIAGPSCKRLVAKEPIGVKDLAITAVDCAVKVELTKGRDDTRAFVESFPAQGGGLGHRSDGIGRAVVAKGLCHERIEGGASRKLLKVKISVVVG